MKLCFTTYVFGWYQDYIPTYIYSILHAFPQHFVKIFVKEKLTENNKQALDLVKKQISNSFEIIEEFDDLDHCGIPHLPAIRFLLTRDYFEEFDYVYFGDVDFVIYNQWNDSFADRYVEHMKHTGLPFSNEWNYDYGKYRMTGLHFIQKDFYFDVMDPFIEEMKIPNGNFFRKQCRHNPKWPSYDEEMLFNMAVRAFDIRPLDGYRRPFHGLHFGTLRILDVGDSFVENKAQESDGRNYLQEWRNEPKIHNILLSPLFKDLNKLMGKKAHETIFKTQTALYRKMFA